MAAPVVVILAAGQGTRMRSAVQKLLHPLCGRPIIEWTVEVAREGGAGRIVLVDSPERRLDAYAGDRIEIAVQPQTNGTAGAVRAAIPHLEADDTVLVINGDLPLLAADTVRAMADRHSASGAAGTISTIEADDPSGYGRIVRAPDGSVDRIVETKGPGDATEAEMKIREINVGIYAFDGGPLIEALGHVRPDNAQGELYLPDVLPILRELGHTIEAFALDAEGVDPDELLQINDRKQLAEVTTAAQRQICERHMLAGVTIVNPAATTIDVGVTIGQDTVIEPFTTLRGATAIGQGNTIGPGSTLIDATVGDGATILHSYITGAEVGDRVNVGPFAYLRPGTVMREGSKAGTFVEIKNSDVGAGTKVPHLSYIGDAEIGEGTNLGAATITANYDGYVKHRTKIGSRVKTSVDTTLIAPVEVGDDAYTAAGSVISNDIPSGALGVARARQSNIEGYAQRRAERAAAEHKEAP